MSIGQPSQINDFINYSSVASTKAELLREVEEFCQRRRYQSVPKPVSNAVIQYQRSKLARHCNEDISEIGLYEKRTALK